MYNDASAEGLLEEMMAKKLPYLSCTRAVIPPMKQDVFCKCHCSMMHKSSVGM